MTAGGINPTDAILDVIGDAEAGVDRGRAAGAAGRGVEGGGGAGLVVMSRELLVRQVGRDASIVHSFLLVLAE